MRKTPSTEQVDSLEASAAADARPSAVVPNAGAAVTRSPAQWAEVYFPASESGRHHGDLWKHAAAEQLHGWASFVARTGRPVQLTADLYEMAIAAISGGAFTPYPDADYRTRS